MGIMLDLTLMLLAGMVYVTGWCSKSGASITRLRSATEVVGPSESALVLIDCLTRKEVNGYGFRRRERPIKFGVITVWFRVGHVSIFDTPIYDQGCDSAADVQHSILRGKESEGVDPRVVPLVARPNSGPLNQNFWALTEIMLWRWLINVRDERHQFFDNGGAFSVISECENRCGEKCQRIVQLFVQVKRSVNGEQSLSLGGFDYSQQCSFFNDQIRSLGDMRQFSGPGALLRSLDVFRCGLAVLFVRSFREFQLGICSGNTRFGGFDGRSGRFHLFISRFFQRMRGANQLAGEYRDQNSGSGSNTRERDHPWRFGTIALVIGTACLCWSARRAGQIQWSFMLLGFLLYQVGLFTLAYGAQWGLGR
jgi:hypothetical protein